MLRIRLKKKFLYKVIDKDRMIEYHCRYTYLDIGYKGSIYFITITQEDWCNSFLGATMRWNSGF